MEGFQILTMKKLTVLGAGSAGCRIIGALRTAPGAENLYLLSFDSDVNALEQSGLPESNRIIAGAQWREGGGCGGNCDTGRTAASAERDVLAALLADTKMLVVVAGLGGGFGSGSLSVIQSVVSRMKIPTVFLLTTPFALEGPTRGKVAEQTISNLLSLNCVVVTVPNDLLFGTLKASVELKEAVALSDKAMGQAAMALAVTLSAGGLLAADFDTLSALLNRKCSECAIARAVVAPDDPERERKLVENLLDSPLLRGSSELKKADAVLAVLNGGEKLSLGDANAVFENLRKYTAADSEILIGAGADPSWGSEMQLVVVTVRFLQKGFPENGSGSTSAKKGRKKSTPVTDEIQLELFEQCNEVGVMEGTDPVMVDGVNLDVPTFMRKNIPVD